MRNTFFLFRSFCCLLLIPSFVGVYDICLADPIETEITLPEGKSPGEVGVEHGDLRAYDILPYFKVDHDGNVLVADVLNGRIQILGADGTFHGIVKPAKPEDSFMFPIDFQVLPGRRLVAFTNTGLMALFDYDNNQLAVVDGVSGSFEGNIPDGRFVIKKHLRKEYLVYNSDLQLVSQFIVRPEELGQNFTYLGEEDEYIWRIEYPAENKCFAFVDRGASLENFARIGDQLFLHSEREIWIIDYDNTITASGILPESVYGPEPDLDESYGFDVEPPVVVEYLPPALGEDGRVYSMLRKPNQLSVVKWNLMELSPASSLIEPIANTPPVLSPVGQQQVVFGEKLNIILSATDADGDGIIYSAENLPTGAQFDLNRHILTWTPNSDQIGTYEVIFNVNDIKCGHDEETVIITVTEN